MDENFGERPAREQPDEGLSQLEEYPERPGWNGIQQRSDDSTNAPQDQLDNEFELLVGDCCIVWRNEQCDFGWRPANALSK